MPFDLEEIDLDELSLAGTPLGDDSTQLRTTMGEAVKANPDDRARVNKMSRETGVPTPAIQDNLEEVEKKFRMDQIDFGKLQRESPVTSNYMSSYDNAAVAHDDLDQLTAMEKVLTPVASAAQATLGLEEGLLRIPEFIEGSLGLASSTVEEATGLPAYLNPMRALEQSARGYRLALDPLTEKFRQARAELPGLAEPFKRVGQMGQKANEAMNEALDGEFTKLFDVISDPEAVSTFVANAVPSLFVAIASGASLPAIMAMEGGGELVGQADFKAEGGEITNAQMVQATAQTALISGLLEKVGADYFRRFPVFNKFFKEADAKGVNVNDILKTAMVEGGTEVLQEFNQNVAEKITFDPEKGLTEGLLQAFIGGTGAGGGVSSVAYAADKINTAMVEQNKQMSVTAKEQAQLEQINEKAEATKLKGRDKVAFKQFVKDTDPESNVFVTATEVVAYLQTKTPEEIAADPALILMSEQVAKAAELGGDVVIPMADFASEITGTEHFDILRDHMTLNAESISPAQQEQNQLQNETYIQSMMAEAQENVSEYVEAQEIFETTKEQLIDTGQMTPQQAGLMAQIVPAYITVKAKENGVTVKEFYEQSGLQITGPQTGKLAALVEKVIPSFLQEEKQEVGGVTSGEYTPSKTLIRLTESANLSTFLHEFAHFMYDMERETGGSARLDSINNWFRRNAADVAAEANAIAKDDNVDVNVTAEDVVTYLDKGATDRLDDGVISKAIHEQFARGFEAYVMEGKAPSIELRNAFRTFARWMAQVYKTVRGDMQVNLDAEMTQVFDRLLATEKQIAMAEARTKFEPMFTDAAMAGMTDEEFAAYNQRQAKSRDKSTETLRDQIIKQLTRQQKAWWKEEKAEIVEQELKALERQLVYAARNALLTGDMKLDLAIVKEQFGFDRTDKLGRTSRRVPDQLRGMTKPGGEGVNPDAAAAFLGYNSGAEMVNDLISAPKIEMVADQNAEAKMIQIHGDIFTDGTIEQQADEAVVNEERGKMILHELKVLARGTNVRAVDQQTLKAMAEDNIGKLSFREIHPAKYRKAEIKAAQESTAMLLEGNREGAAVAKTRQALNYYLGMAATNAKNDTMKIVDRMSRYNKKSVREAIIKAEGGFWEQLQRILERFEFRRAATLKAVDQVNEGLNAWMSDRINNDGDGLMLSAAVMNESYVTHWKNVPYSELVGINDSVKNIEHVARYSNKINLLEEEKTFKEVVAGWVTSMDEKVKSRFKSQRTTTIDGKNYGRWAMAKMSKIPWLASWLDGSERAGLSHDILIQPLTDAYEDEMNMWDEIGNVVTRAINGRSKADVKRHGKVVFIPEIQDEQNDGNLYGHQILTVALNVGNESNMRKLLLGEGWANPDAEEEISFDNPKLQAVLAHMTEADWKLVQLVWTQMELLYPRLSEVHRKTTGLTPPKIKSTPVVTPFGTFTGGYYPVKYDPDRSFRAKRNEDKLNAQTDSMFGASGIQASVNAGAVNERTGYYAPINLNMNVIPNHFQETIHYITHHDAVRQINKLIGNQAVASTIIAKLGKDEFDQLRPWLNDIAKDGREQPIKMIWSPILQQLRFGTTLGVMGFKASTGIIQTLGLSNTIAETGLANTLQAIRSILGSTTTMNEAWTFAVENSKIMATRMNTMDREIKTAMKNLQGKHGILAVAQEASMKHIALIQTYMVDLPSWHSAYIKGMKEWGDESRAFKYADWVVENIQGSGKMMNMSQVMRDRNEASRMVTMFMTFFSSLWNAQRDVVKGARTGAHSRSDTAARLMFILVIPVFLEMLLRGEFGDDDDDESNLQKYLTNLALYPMQAVPFLRDIASGVLGDYGYNVSPIAQIIETGVRTIPAIAEAAVTDEELTKSQIKGASKVVGAAAGMPGVNQAWATGEHLYDVLEDGEDFSLHSFLYGPPRK